jgi:tRNA(Ile)-lysidine synthetase-like protein
LVQLKLHGADQTISGWADNKEGYNKQEQALDWERLPKPLMLRCWRPGDRYQPQGCNRPKKLKALFQEGRIAAWDRKNWPVITAPAPLSHSSDLAVVAGESGRGEVVIWVHEFGPAQKYAAEPGTRTVLEITAFWSERRKNLEILL